MPTISIFIRKDDLPKWQAIPNKSEWLHNALVANPVNDIVQAGREALKQAESTLKDADLKGLGPITQPQPFVPKPPDPELGYPCCQSRTYRCKHWEWDGTRGNWVNTLTGKELEE